MRPALDNPIVHLELHSGNMPRACAFYARLFGWRAESVEAGGGSYLALALSDEFGGGAVECETERPLWLPYVEVPQIAVATERAQRLGASVLLGPREGAGGWRSVVAVPSGAEVALWQAKR